MGKINDKMIEYLKTAPLYAPMARGGFDGLNKRMIRAAMRSREREIRRLSSELIELSK